MQSKKSAKEENAREAQEETEKKAAEVVKNEQAVKVKEDSDDEFKDAEEEISYEEVKEAGGELEANDLFIKEKYRVERAEELLEKSKHWEVSKYSDDHKCENAGFYGGFQL